MERHEDFGKCIIKLMLLMLLVLSALAVTRKFDSRLISGDIQDFLVREKFEKSFTQTELYDRLKDFSVTGDIITSTSNDPWIFLDTSDVKPYKYIKIDIDLFSPLSGLEAQFFYMLSGKQFNEDDSKKVRLKNGINYIRIPYSNYDALRLDITSLQNYPLSVKSVELTNKFIPSLSNIMILALLNIIWCGIGFLLLFQFKSIKILLSMTNIYNLYIRKPLLSITVFILLLSVFLYRDFIVTGTSILFAVHDGFHYEWPYLVNLSDYIKTYGFPRWSFNMGLGSAYPSNAFIWIGNPFILLPVLLGKNTIPYIMVFMQIAKMTLAGLFFYLYLQKFSLGKIACLIPSLFYAFSGIMITRGFWNIFSLECFCVALILYAVELYLKNKKWYLIPLATFLLASGLGPYYIYLYCILIFVYLTLRYIDITDIFKMKYYFIYIGKCAILFFIGILLSAVFVLPQVFNMLQTARFAQTMGGIDILHFVLDLFSSDNMQKYISEFYRFFSPDILGKFYYYSGWGNYLEGPLFYCGLMVLLLIPQLIFLVERKKTKRLFAIALVATLIYLLFPNVRRIMEGFIHGGGYRLSSLWVCIMLLTIFAYVINRLSIGKSVNIRTLLLTFILLMVFFIGFGYIAPDYDIKLEKASVLLVMVFLVIYLFIFYLLGNTDSNKRAVFITMFCVGILEIFLFSNTTVDAAYKEAEVYKKYLDIEDRTGYFDYSVEAINFINLYDSDFFRIDKKNMVHLNDPVFLGYYGSSYYDTFVQHSYFDFLQAVNAGNFVSSPLIVYSFGLRDRPILETLTGFKYIVCDLNFIPPFGFEYLMTIVDKRIFRNRYVLPLGFTYTKYISEDKFKTFDNLTKDLTLLNAIIINEGSDKLMEYTPSILNENIDAFINKDSVSFINMVDIENDLPGYLEGTAISIDPMVIIPVSSEGLFLSYDIEFNIVSDADTTVQLFWESESNGFNDMQSLTHAIKAREKTLVKFNILGSILKNIRIDPGVISGGYQIENLRITYNRLEDLYVEGVNGRKQEPFIINQFSQNHITGTVEAAGNRMLFFSIPYNKGWTLKIDDKLVKIEKVNIGFIGAEISEGLHSVELKYFTPGLLLGIILSLIGLSFFVTLIIFRKKLRFF
jgi:uncharacterized membrane protein YfhO